MSFKYPALFIVSVYSLLCAGCFSNYSITDFSSKDEFYQRINNFSNSKNVNVALKNDRTIKNYRIEVKNDSLFLINQKREKKEQVIPLSSIAEINYSSIDYHSADIILKNGQEYQSESIIVLRDSMKFLSIQEKIILLNTIPVEEINEVSYKNNWLGVPGGILSGAAAGALMGITGVIPVHQNRPDMQTGGQKEVFDTGGAMIYGAVSGAVIGGILGWIVGYNNVYKFPGKN